MLTWKFHTGPVYDVAFTPDGRLLTCSSDQLIRLWDVSTRTELRRWECKKGTMSLAVSPDGRFFARGAPSEVIVWRAEGGDLIIRAEGCRALTFSPNDDGFVAVGSGRSQSTWSLPEGMPITTVAPFHGDHVAFHPDGKLLATAINIDIDEEHTTSCVCLLSAVTGKAFTVLTPSKRKEYGGPLAFTPDGRFLASIHGAAVVVWDVETRTEIVRRAPNKKEMKGLAFTADGTRMLTAGHDELVRVWAAPNWEEVTSFEWKIGRIKCLTVNREGTLAAVGGDRGKVVVWDLD